MDNIKVNSENIPEKQLMKTVLANLEEGVQKFMTSEHYLDYLKIMSRFPHYSFNNLVLIGKQMPEATQVAGYHTWKKQFGRQVKTGEHGIRIIVPKVIEIQKEGEKAEHKLTFGTRVVFDVSQTEGRDLPTLSKGDLTDAIPNYRELLAILQNVSPVPIRIEQSEVSMHGYYDRQKREIVISPDLSEAQSVKTLVHEIAHSIMHEQSSLERPEMEVQAESVAYAVCSHLGVDTSDYSFPYITSWSQGKDLQLLRKSMEKVRETAEGLCGRIDELMEKNKEREGHFIETERGEMER